LEREKMQRGNGGERRVFCRKREIKRGGGGGDRQGVLPIACNEDKIIYRPIGGMVNL